MSNVSEWSTNANDNDATPPNGAPEGMARSSVNDVMREMMAAVARMFGDQNGSLVSAGSAGAYTLTTNSDHQEFADAGILTFVANHNCPGTSTLAVDGEDAKPLRSRLGEELAANAFLEDDTLMTVWNAEGEYYALIAPAPRFSLVEMATPQALIQPGGRLSLATGVAVHTTEQAAKSTIFRVPHRGALIPLWDGTFWRVKEFAETSQALSDTTKSPAAAVLNSLYDYFDWDDDGTILCTRGPAWSNATARGTGAGSTELELFGGVLVNKFDITNGPLARRGLYRGTIATDSSVQLNMMFLPNAAAGGSANRLDVWNAYNRVDVSSVCRDSTNSWDYATATVRAANNSNSNRITTVCGLVEDRVLAAYHVSAAQSSGAALKAGVGLDAVDAFSGLPASFAGNVDAARPTTLLGSYRGYPGLGRHFFQACEWGEATGTARFFGDNNQPTLDQSGLILDWRM